MNIIITDNNKGLETILGSIEVIIMEYLWTKGSGNIRDITIEFQHLGKEKHPNTIQTVINRLIEKGYVKKMKRLKGHDYYPNIKARDLITTTKNNLTKIITEIDLYLKSHPEI